MSAALVVLATVLVLSFIIFVHEAAHYLVARKAGMKVEEFFLGFGPRLYSWRRGETEYGVKWILFGGYVKIAGMDPLHPPAEEDLPRTYGAKPMRWRAAVILAGPLTHFVLAFIGAWLLVSVVGIPVYGIGVGQVLDSLNDRESPAKAAGIVPGDVIVSVDGKPAEQVDLEQALQDHVDVGQPLHLVIRRDGTDRDVVVTPVLGPGEDQQMIPRIGVLTSPAIIGRDHLGPVASTKESLVLLADGTTATVQGIGRVFSPAGIARTFSQVFGDTPRTVEDPMTFVGITRVVVDFAEQGRVDILLQIFVQLNIFVGLLNLVPLPPFDGGHLAILAIERIRHRKVDMLKVMPVAAAVLILLVTYMGLVLFLDIFEPLNPGG